MKKLAVLTTVAIACLGSRAQAATLTYLVNFGPTNTPAYLGTPTNFDSASGTALPATTVVVNPGPGETYTLGAYTLTLAGNVYSFAAGDQLTPPVNLAPQMNVQAVTDSFAYQTGGGTSTFTLTGLPASDTINFQLLGSSQNFLDNASVVAGSTAPTTGTTEIAYAPAGSTPVFTNLATLSNSTTYSGVFTQHGSGEGDVGAAYITITTAAVVVPEPSTYLMFGVGCAFLLFLVRRRAA